MTLHSIVTPPHPPAWWHFRSNYRIGANITLTPEALRNNRLLSEVQTDIQRRLSADIRTAAREYGYHGTLQMETTARRASHEDPLSPVAELGIITRLPYHIWFSTNCQRDWRPLAVIEGGVIEDIPARTNPTCECAVCCFLRGENPAGGPEGTNGWRRVGFEQGWLQSLIETEEVEPPDDARQQPVAQNDLAPLTHLQNPALANRQLQNQEEELIATLDWQVCWGCLAVIHPDSETFTSEETGQRYHLRCAMDEAHAL